MINEPLGRGWMHKVCEWSALQRRMALTCQLKLEIDATSLIDLGPLDSTPTEIL